MRTFTSTPPNPPCLLRRNPPSLTVSASSMPPESRSTTASRRQTLTLSSILVLTAGEARGESWGTRSFIRERFFEPGLSAEDAVARIRQTAEGLRSIREMLEHLSWRYVIFYIRLKQAYLSQDLKNAISTVPETRRNDYVKTANELVDNMAELDYYVRTPKVYESYLYYEKTLKSIDDLVALLV